MTTRYKPNMTTAAFIELAFEMSCEEVLEHVANGTIPATVASFSALHDHMDANCLGGFCDEDLKPVFEAIFKRNGEDDAEWFSNGFMQATGATQNRVDAWLRAGGVLEAQIEQRLVNGACSANDDMALLVNKALKSQTGEGMQFEQWECLFDIERASEASDMLDDIHARVLNNSIKVPDAASNA